MTAPSPLPRTRFLFPAVRRSWRAALVLGLAVCSVASPVARAAETGVITGSVSNTATGNLLEGARISVAQLGLSTLTDNTGRFVLTHVPVGTHEIVASYIGLDSAGAASWCLRASPPCAISISPRPSISSTPSK